MKIKTLEEIVSKICFLNSKTIIGTITEVAKDDIKVCFCKKGWYTYKDGTFTFYNDTDIDRGLRIDQWENAIDALNNYAPKDTDYIFGDYTYDAKGGYIGFVGNGHGYIWNVADDLIS